MSSLQQTSQIQQLKSLGQFSVARDKIMSNKQLKTEYEAIKVEIFKKPQIELFKNRLKMPVNMCCLSDNETLIRKPVLHSQCTSKERCFDLYNILYKIHHATNKKIICPSCQSEITIDTLKSSFAICTPFDKFVNQSNGLVSRIFAWNITGKITFSHSFNSNNKRRKALLEEDDKFADFILVLLKKQEINFNFGQVYRSLVEVKTNNFTSICSFDGIKLKLPIRHINCTHLQCFELTSILQRINQKVFELCPVEGCTTVFNFSLDQLVNEIGIDRELLKSLNEGFSFAINFYIDSQKRSIADKNILNNYDSLLKELWEQYGKQFENYSENKDEQMFKTLYSQCFSQFGLILNRGKNQSKAIQPTVQLYQSFEVNLQDEITKKIAVYPSRCIRCTQIDKCIDLRTFIFLINQKKSKKKDDTPFSCPICNQIFDSSINDREIFDEIYLDFNIYQEILLNPQFIEQKKIKYDGKNHLLKIFQKQQVLRNENTMSQFGSKPINYQYSSAICKISQKQIQIPLIKENCEHQNFVDFEELYKYYQANNYKIKNLKICDQCAVINSFDELRFDSIFYKIIEGKQLQQGTMIRFKGKVKELVPVEVDDFAINISTDGGQFALNTSGNLNNNKIVQSYKFLNEEFKKYEVGIETIILRNQQFSLKMQNS